MNYYLGLMSGTSLDGVDGVILSLNEKPELIHVGSISFPDKLYKQLSELIIKQQGTLKEIGSLSAQLGQLYAYLANQLINQASLSPKDIIAIGCHGQTIYHKPDDAYPFTWQLGDMHQVAQQTQITTIGDFRGLDIAYGGQGAPLAPALHQALFSDNNIIRAIVNLGGISNVTCLNTSNNDIIGFDTGPSNTLLDLWYQQHHNTDAYDIDGQWAQSGTIIKPLLNEMLNDEYFKRSAPKSTGREYFNLNWLNQYLNKYQLNDLNKAEDVQATLVELTAITIKKAIEAYQPNTQEIYLCGGGSLNLYLIERIKAQLSPIKVDSTSQLGIEPQWVEAALIAWLAKMRLEHSPSNIPSVTGASEQLSLGVIYLPK
ncbi:anhydro-N-acetylmuramic acid kinase [Thiotrichales bacterium 19S9-12]|nr:anhydro-N-acetylmuramic acid kinase [Thiotrichales bacterium 19S9-11]MCF6811131.1 anhydro-N-acetylmuramic acid kinase [Thiotrichales bacterium 19S9-12]